MDFKLITVGIADMRITSAPDILRTILGSCVGICLYDHVSRLGGMSHIMLPIHKEKTSSMTKYADTAIPMMADEMVRLGADMKRITAKIIGGSTMFNVGQNSIMGEIGKNNILMVRSVLNRMRIRIIAEDVGGDYGRTIDFFVENGSVKIRSMGKNEKVI
ncbi:MAG: chemotaxis protein CheD [Spirochaetes bacterium]|nr:chemotaxis protein CheD [Spirochaetota bacterium]